MAKWIHKLTRKERVLEWWKSLTAAGQVDLFIEKEIGSDAVGGVWIMQKKEPLNSVIFRVGNKAFRWFDVEEMDCPFINRKFYKIVDLKPHLKECS